MDAVVQQVDGDIRRHHLLPGGGRIVVAVSGGADSVALLHLLHALAPARAWHLIVAHFDHQLRGAASRADAAWVRRFAARLGLPCELGTGDVRAAASARGESLEMTARDLRHRHLYEIARRHGASRIALGHHADDQIETFLLRLLRGCGPDGLAGMGWCNPSPVAPDDPAVALVRPLLGLHRNQIQEYLQRHRLQHRVDVSNHDESILRNRVRQRLLPLLRREFQPGIDQVLLRLMTLLAGENEVMESLAAGVPPATTPPPAGLRRRMLRRELLRLGVAPAFDLIEALIAQPGTVITAPGGRRLVLEPGGTLTEREAGPELSTERTDDKAVVDLTGKGGRLGFAGRSFSWRIQRTGRRPAAAAHREYFDADRVGNPVRLRHWRPGDRFQPLGLPAPVKLQDWFVNRKIPRSRRHELVVAETAEGVIWWVEGERIDARFRLTGKTRRRLTWQWEPA